MSASLDGRVLDQRYALGRRLSEGSMGAIYRAVRLADRVPVAVKIIKPILGSDPELVRRFHAEIEATRRLRHPNLVELLDHGHDGLLYLVMELLLGRSLDVVVVTEAPLEPLRVAGIGRQVAAGLEAAHLAGVVHRDLKPENVIVRREPDGRDRVKVFDFGLSFPSRNTPDQTRITAVELRLGTPAFMAPEYIASGTFDARSDLYALGVMLYECCCGDTPFVGPSFSLLDQQLHAAPRPLSERCEAPVWLTDTVMQLLCKDPDDRPASAGEVIRRLRPEGGAAAPA